MSQFKKGKFSRNLAATAILAPTLAIVGCSSSSSSSSDNGGDGSTEGFAYDGYLNNAVVCIDENLNKACDFGEPTTTTGAGGRFTFDTLTDAQLQLPLVLQATANTTDEDDNASVDTNLKFLAPAGSKAVSGFSTIVQAKIEKALAGGSTASLEDLKASAAAELAGELGVSGVDLTAFDPIAAKADESASEDAQTTAAKLHLVNQVLSQQIATLVPQASANANGDETAAFGALVNNLNATNVKQAVDNDTAGLALPELKEALADVIVSEVTPLVPTTEEIEEQAAIDEIVQEIIQEVVAEEEEPTGATGGTGS
ncbi:hypothetical protein [uncultured Marinobacter sp.]|uniref:hypothetical protein n=1 Tax=uncultured Marinobacter sp. TaxID=187379 RepID=UPI00261A7FE4|nr:hypothetical protein [uncultured Marinobacter sp.]